MLATAQRKHREKGNAERGRRGGFKKRWKQWGGKDDFARKGSGGGIIPAKLEGTLLPKKGKGEKRTPNPRGVHAGGREKTGTACQLAYKRRERWHQLRVTF